ncbi:MAG: glycosyltransferase [Proteobacteria bacterium]|nr:glycosyltransferase [Pseudomonadota bacterium]
MAHIHFAWELGAGYGHLMGIKPVADALAARGHKISLAACDLRRAQMLFADRDYDLFEAPLGQHKGIIGEHAPNYAALLGMTGHKNANDSQDVISRWRDLIDEKKPDVILAEHAPSALLAARITGTPAADFGSGFMVPPTQLPMPLTTFWEKFETGQLEKIEVNQVAVLNDALKPLGGKPLYTIADLFDLPDRFLCTLPELDHYMEREPSDFMGVLYSSPEGAKPRWPQGKGPKVFVYLAMSGITGHSLIPALQKLGWPTIMQIRDVTPDAARKIKKRTLRLEEKPVDLPRIMKQADLVICHASFGTTVQGILAGKPMLLMPQHAEQYMMAHQFVRMNAGVITDQRWGTVNYEALLTRLIEEKKFLANAGAFAAKYEHFDMDAMIETICDRTEAMLSGMATG